MSDKQVDEKNSDEKPEDISDASESDTNHPELKISQGDKLIPDERNFQDILTAEDKNSYETSSKVMGSVDCKACRFNVNCQSWLLALLSPLCLAAGIYMRFLTDAELNSVPLPFAKVVIHSASCVMTIWGFNSTWNRWMQK